MNRRSLILSVLALGATGFAGAAWYINRSRPVTDAQPIASNMTDSLIRPYSPILGSEDAPVTIVEFFDPACEACRAFHPVVKEILEEHGQAVRVVIRYTPFHGEGSELAIRILEAARMQGIFEPVLEAILRHQPNWASHGGMRPELLLGIVASAGFDTSKGKTQLLAPQTTAVLNQDRADVETVGVRQTPTFFVNGIPLDPFGQDELRRLVAAEVDNTKS